MKKLILAIISAFFTVTITSVTAQAADQVITITIPSQHVSRVVDAIAGELNCGELGPKACLKKELIQNIKKLVRRHETKPIMENAHTQVGDIVDPEIN